MTSDRRVFTIPAGAPFLATLADALASGRLFAEAQPSLGDAVVYLPTRRAARAFASVLAQSNGGRAQLLPRIVPLGDADEAEFELATGRAEFESAALLAPPIAPLERRLILARLIQRWLAQTSRTDSGAGVPLVAPASPAEALALAGDLEQLMDGFAIEGVPPDALGAAVEVDLSHYYAKTLEFVGIAVENWPRILAERGASDPAERRSALIAAEAHRLLRERPATPIVAAGSTGSIPSTAALLAAIAQLPNGAVVLPGLDQDLDEAGWGAVGGSVGERDFVHGHPQAVMRCLLDEHLRIGRGAVGVLGEPREALRARSRLLSQALRPAATTHCWAAMDAAAHGELAEAALDGVVVIEAADEREEALAAAIALREAIDEPGRTAALVTPDRALAARVAAELGRWGLAVDDSAGVPLADTPAGRLARLTADAAAHDFHPTRVLALLAHPLVRLGQSRAAVERAAAALEIGVLRGPAPAPGLDGLQRALEVARTTTSRHVLRPRRRLSASDWASAADLLARLVAAFGAFTLATQGDGAIDLVALAEEHRNAVDRLRDGPEDVLQDDAAEALDRLFDDLSTAEPGGIEGRLTDYPAFFANLARSGTVVPSRAIEPRITILGLLEARLLSADRIVLGGLDEGVWPPRAQTDAFLNRPMRARIGLTSPEQRIGQTAHDFVQLLGNPDVVITRAHKRDGVPTVPSRLLQRIKAFAGEAAWSSALARGERYRNLTRALDRPQPTPPIARPAPTVEPALFPRVLSVTEIETLVRDPYAIFARHILKLDPLDAVAASPTAAYRGTMIHDILGSFTALHPNALPEHAAAELLQRGEDAFRPLQDAYPKLYAEWWPRFKRLATAFIAWERNRRADILMVHPEVPGRLPIPLITGDEIVLRVRADRIEARRDGGFAIIDFKTGTPPTNPQVFAGFAPQLTLEAAMLMEAAFLAVPGATATPDLCYVNISGGRVPLKVQDIDPPGDEQRSVAELVVEHRRNLERLLTEYLIGERAFMSRPFPKYARSFSEYDHLARVKEWSLASIGSAEEAV